MSPLQDENFLQQDTNCQTLVKKIVHHIRPGEDLQQVIQTLARDIYNIVKFDYFSLSLMESDKIEGTVCDIASRDFMQNYKTQDNWQAITDSHLGWISAPVN